jgi:hypothetical protein
VEKSTDKTLDMPSEPEEVEEAEAASKEESCCDMKQCSDASQSCEDQQKSNVMTITKCPHVHRKHYAKNMCSSCYRKFGRNQNAFNCEHTDRLLYSMGMCQTCYLSDYHKRRTKVKRKAQQLKNKEAKEEAKRAAMADDTTLSAAVSAQKSAVPEDKQASN